MMDFDFSLILVALTLITGAVWLIDAVFFAKKRQVVTQQAGTSAPAGEGRVSQGWTVDGAGSHDTAAREPVEPLVVEYCRSFFPILFIVLILRSFIVEPFQIPSQSMLPTLEVGDFILVNKFTYGLRLPVVGTEILDLGEPERGDVMVFRNPEDNRTNYIKRVIGLPGDTVTLLGKELYLNGEPVEQRLLAALPPDNPKELIYEESLGGSAYRIQKESGPSGLRAEWKVPAGHFFLLGDNRDRSRDSRYIGMVPENNIVGRAFAIWMHWESFFSIPSFSRSGLIE
ncbi:signal peptidase I [Allohahella marinimesophila]|uniref:Signal peptidase I n=1 Tax=Allohahella marinimesophila TaxID=1054972 RepID=A0ABP7Q559_9GAMM